MTDRLQQEQAEVPAIDMRVAEIDNMLRTADLVMATKKGRTFEVNYDHVLLRDAPKHKKQSDSWQPPGGLQNRRGR